MESIKERIEKFSCILFDLNEKYENYNYIGIRNDEFFKYVGAVEDRIDEIEKEETGCDMCEQYHNQKTWCRKCGGI